MVSSRVYPDLERKPGGPDNWVEAAGGLPSYIERIAKHLHYEQGMSISRAIASAVNTVKRWARGGKVAKYGDPNNKRVSAATIAKAQAALAQWEAKKKAGALALSDEVLLAIDLTDVTDEFALGLIDLAGVQDLSDADISATDTMVALMLPKAVASKIAVEGGVPVDDLHVTITFHGDTDESQFNKLAEDLKAWASDMPNPQPLKGTIGGIGTFPADDSKQGAPWYVPVDVPGLNTLHEQVQAVADRSVPAKSNHGYTPHITLTYVAGDEAPPPPVESIPVEFNSIWVVRGNTQRVEIPLSVGTGADLSERAILSSGNIDLSKGLMDIAALAERANRIEDPVQRASARATILDLAFGRECSEALLIDLASTIAPRNPSGKAKDGRRRYDDQGKWGHGFVPKNRAAMESKAKGSPIAIQRLRRIFGKKGGPDKKEIKVNEDRGTGSESAQDVAFLRRSEFQDERETKNTKPEDRLEESKQPRVSERARQEWSTIPEELKTVRNGKRYVLATFGGKQILTEWLGGVNEADTGPLSSRKVMRTLSSADAANMSAADLRRLLKNPRTPDSVRKVVNKALRKKEQEAKSRA